jgi:hypothetical protein
MSFLKHIKALGVDALDLTQRVLLATDGTLRIPAEGDQHSWLIAIMIPA